MGSALGASGSLAASSAFTSATAYSAFTFSILVSFALAIIMSPLAFSSLIFQAIPYFDSISLLESALLVLYPISS